MPIHWLPLKFKGEKMTNDWGLTYNMVYAVSKGKKRIYERESFAVKLCPKCNIPYEVTRNDYKQTVTTHYHEDFPRRGLYPQICLKCK